MSNERWIVMPPSSDGLQKIPEEQVAAGTPLVTKDGSPLLMYRDHFTACKAAHYAGTRAQRGQVMKDDGRRQPGALDLGDGDLLLLAAAPDTLMGRSTVTLRPGWYPSNVRPQDSAAV